MVARTIGKYIVPLACLLGVFSANAEIVGMNVSRSASEEEMIASLQFVELIDENGNHVRLKSLLDSQRPSLVTLWANWCLNCRAEIPGYQAIRKTCPEAWNIIFISAQAKDYKKDLAKYKSFNLPWKFYHVAEAEMIRDRKIKMMDAFYGKMTDGAILTPLHYLIAKSGRVDAIVNAKMDFNQSQKLDAFCRQ
jgi:thiol-disulfide isomerase/thioredoxin